MFLGANRIVLMRSKDKIFDFFQEKFGKTKISHFLDLAYQFLHSLIKIEHMYYLLAKRIINFHLFLQNIFDLEVWTRFPNFPIYLESQLWTPGHISSSRMNF